MNSQLCTEILAHLGDEDVAKVTRAELRAAITAYPTLGPDALLTRCQVLIPTLIGLGVLFQDGGKYLYVSRIRHLFTPAHQRAA